MLKVGVKEIFLEHILYDNDLYAAHLKRKWNSSPTMTHKYMFNSLKANIHSSWQWQ